MKFLRKIIGYKLALRPVRNSSESKRMRLLSIIRHANENTPFYNGIYDKFLEHEHDLSDEEFFYAFSHLPIIEERHLQKHSHEFKSDHLLNKPSLLDENNTITISLQQAVIKKDFQIALPIGIFQNQSLSRWMDYDDANNFIQSTLTSFRKNGWKEGQPLTIFTPASSFLSSISSSNAKILNRYFGLTVISFNEINKETVENLLGTLKKTKSTLLSISPRVLTRVAQVMHNEDIEPFIKLPYINVSGGYFMDCSKAFTQRMFPDSDIQTSYSSSKYGTIAHQKNLNSFNYDVFHEHAFLEQGPNNSILITSYKQCAFPLIRYKIEDMGQIINDDDGTQTIEFLEGKNTEYLIGADNYMYFSSYFNHVINEINKELHDPIIDFTLRYSNKGKKSLDLNFIVQKPEKKDKIKATALKTIGKVFSNYGKIKVNFLDYFEHDYTKTLNLIEENHEKPALIDADIQRKAS